MGSYLIIPKKTPVMWLINWFEKYKPFYNDFGKEHLFEDIFGEVNKDGNIRFKYGVQQQEGFKSFYSEEALKEIKSITGVKDETEN